MPRTKLGKLRSQREGLKIILNLLADEEVIKQASCHNCPFFLRFPDCSLLDLHYPQGFLIYRGDDGHGVELGAVVDVVFQAGLDDVEASDTES